MFTAVVKPFTYAGQPFTPGEVIDSTPMRNEKHLIGARYLRVLSPHEYAEAVGLVNAQVEEDESENTDSTTTNAPNDGAEDEADISYDDAGSSDDQTEEATPAAAPRRARKATAKRTRKAARSR